MLLFGKHASHPRVALRVPGKVARRGKGKDGVTLVELLIAAAALALVSGVAISGLTMLNTRAAIERNQSSAKELCQQAIEQALALPFDPPTTVPAIFGGTWPPSVSGTSTAPENVQLYVQKENENTVIVQGTRTNTVALADSTTNLIQFTTRVDYSYRGKNYKYEMYTLRAPN
jgi:prepilin-type N-terminal cleavage/methylation domain-containing protein